MYDVFREDKAKTARLQQFIEQSLILPDGLRYAYFVVSKRNPSEVLIISSYPEEWVTRYYDAHLQLMDPVVLKAFKCSSPFEWDKNMTLISGLRLRGIFSRARQYNITSGFTFVLHDHMNNLTLLSFITADSESGQRLFSDRGKLQMKLIEINAEMYRLAGTASGSRTGRKNETEKIHLTSREHQVLYWASMGKTYGETAIILGISISTVKFHMHNIVSRLGVSNARQAIRLSTELELFTDTAP
ncbi:LuxR family transcriptional regulator [Yokenella regensburgei]|jgi:LuxR family transcriptional regulator, quorum-sensing system regulator ExpR|uniref:LuxR family transcriptional regulator n=1 Tax=Yokenella regensburgei TaxID=158877 RepID=UPI003EDAC848